MSLEEKMSCKRRRRDNDFELTLKTLLDVAKDVEHQNDLFNVAKIELKKKIETICWKNNIIKQLQLSLEKQAKQILELDNVIKEKDNTIKELNKDQEKLNIAFDEKLEKIYILRENILSKDNTIKKLKEERVVDGRLIEGLEVCRCCVCGDQENLVVSVCSHTTCNSCMLRHVSSKLSAGHEPNCPVCRHPDFSKLYKPVVGRWAPKIILKDIISTIETSTSCV
jgi:hypothetical protein